MNDERLVYLSGEFVPESRAAISIFDWGIMYGHLVFEVTRSFAHELQASRAFGTPLRFHEVR